MEQATSPNSDAEEYVHVSQPQSPSKSVSFEMSIPDPSLLESTEEVSTAAEHVEKDTTPKKEPTVNPDEPLPKSPTLHAETKVPSLPKGVETAPISSKPARRLHTDDEPIVPGSGPAVSPVAKTSPRKEAPALVKQEIQLPKAAAEEPAPSKQESQRSKVDIEESRARSKAKKESISAAKATTTAPPPAVPHHPSRFMPGFLERVSFDPISGWNPAYATVLYLAVLAVWC